MGTDRQENGIWKETGGESAKLQRDQERLEEFERLKSSLASCVVCGKPAKIVRFGRKGNGIWIGCDSTPMCCRNIEYHSEGWSLSDAIKEWNFYNTGLIRLIRGIKIWYSMRFGRYAKQEMAEKEAEERIKSQRIDKIMGNFTNKEAKNKKRDLKSMKKG